MKTDFANMGSNVHWDDLKFFLAVANAKSLSGASEQLKVSPSTVSRRVEALEAALRVRLFRPHRDGYDLTQAGRDLVPAAERASAQMRIFERNAQEMDSDHAGPVCIEAPELLGQDVILPALGVFIEAHPEIKIELRSSVKSVRLAGEEADIVLRIVRPEQGSYRMRKLGKISFRLYASAKYVELNGMPNRPEELHQHRVIGWSEDLHYLSMALWLENLCPGLRPALRVSSLSAQLVAAKHGLGWAVLPSFAAEAAELVSALGDATSLDPSLWLLVHEQSAAIPRVKLVRAFLLDTLS